MMPTRKFQNHTINIEEEFVPKKEKIYLLSREKREEVHKFIVEQLRKEYIKPSNLSQIAPVFFVRKKDRKREWFRTINIQMNGQ